MVDSVIQLNQSDCLWKLSRDLLYLFIYHPTPTFSMPLSDLLTVYAECFGRKLVPAVYAAKKFQQLMGGKHTVKVLKVGMVLYIYMYCATQTRIQIKLIWVLYILQSGL